MTAEKRHQGVNKGGAHGNHRMQTKSHPEISRLLERMQLARAGLVNEEIVALEGGQLDGRPELVAFRNLRDLGNIQSLTMQYSQEGHRILRVQPDERLNIPSFFVMAVETKEDAVVLDPKEHVGLETVVIVTGQDGSQEETVRSLLESMESKYGIPQEHKVFQIKDR